MQTLIHAWLFSLDWSFIHLFALSFTHWTNTGESIMKHIVTGWRRGWLHPEHSLLFCRVLVNSIFTVYYIQRCDQAWLFFSMTLMVNCLHVCYAGMCNLVEWACRSFGEKKKQNFMCLDKTKIWEKWNVWKTVGKRKHLGKRKYMPSWPCLCESGRENLSGTKALLNARGAEKNRGITQ